MPVLGKDSYSQRMNIAIASRMNTHWNGGMVTVRGIYMASICTARELCKRITALSRILMSFIATKQINP
jgi:hypothetical protein